MDELSPAVGSHRPRRVRELDFRRPMKFTREQLRVIERAQESFCRSASSRLSVELRSEVSLSLQGTTQMPFASLIDDELPAQALVLVLQSTPLETPFMMVLDTASALALVACSLGGGSNDEAQRDELTEIDIAVAQRSLAGLMEGMNLCWQEMCGIEFKTVAVETSPLEVQIAGPSDPALMISFDFQLDEHVGGIALIAPWESMLPVLPSISTAREESSANEPDAHTARALGRVQVDLRAQAGAKQLTVTELISLQEGDLIVFPQREADGVVLAIEEAELYVAQHGESDGRRAAQVVRRCEPTR